MNFTVELNEFQEAVNKTLPAIPPKSTLPVLEHLKFELEDGKLKIISTDQEITIRTELDVENGSNGKVLIPGRKLNEILKALGNTDKITLKTDTETYEIDIITDFGTYEMKGLSEDEYLELPELFETSPGDIEEPGEINAKVSREEVIRLSDKTAFAVSNDDFRPAMTGVLFQFRKDHLNAVSTDSYRLVKAIYRTEEGDLPEELDVIVPSRTMDILKKADEDVVFSFIKNNEKITHIKFQIGNTVYVSRIIDEKFPPYETVIPDNNNIYATIEKSKLISAIKRVSIFANDITKQIRMNLTSDQLVITGQDEDSGTKADEKLACELDGEPLEIGFNYKFLEESLSHTDARSEGKIVMSFSESNKPILIMPEKDAKDLLMLIMPVRI